MKLLRACIKNFRLLRDVEFKFATGADKNLTVIRAANASGKTTLLTALQWGLFGDDALPERGNNFRLSPLDASIGTDEKVTPEIRVEIDYEISTQAGDCEMYRLIRSVTETVQGGEYTRGGSSIRLFHLSANGTEPKDNPEALIRPYLPKELREVFFTDGDRALNFIEGESGDQMERIKKAIRSLLGFNIIEDALKHVGTVSSDINRKVRKESGSQEELVEVTQKLSDLGEDIPKLEEKYNQAKEARMNLELKEKKTEAMLSDATKKGDKKDLENRREAAKKARITAEEDAEQAASDHANLFKSELLGKHLLADPFQKAGKILDDMRRQGEIPYQTIPVLEDRLNQSACICGESLDEKSSDGKKRREQIHRLIKDSRNLDEIKEKITALYYSAQDLLRPLEGRSWINEFREVYGRRERANKLRKEQGEIERDMEVRISQLPDVDIQKLSAMRDKFREQAREANVEETRLNIKLKEKQREEVEAKQNRNRLLEQDEKGREFISELHVAQDLQDIMNNALEVMKTQELEKVSENMNTLFLDMIGADVDQRSIIKRAGITHEFQIVVFGQGGIKIDPSRGLSGAQRRALTVAFILALTKVSEVEAPNVIDTPLGMAAGFVKTAILQIASQQSSQLILFLTHDEIKGCEEILDKYAGQVYTFTNPADYPKILISDPGIHDIRVLLCECNHRNHCKICERREKIDIGFNSN